MRLVVGRSFVKQVLPRERRAWKLGLLFAHIVRERTSIDMMHGGDRDYGFDNDARRVGVLDNSSTTGSIIRIHRDNDDDDDDREEAQQRGETSSGDGAAAASSDTKTAVAALSSSSSSHRHQRQWFRIHARTHRMFGCPLRSVVLLLTTDRTAPLFFSDTEQFFRRGGGQASSSSSSDSGGQALLQQFDVLFRCKNSFTKEVRELLVPSLELSSWLSVGGGGGNSAVVVDLTTSYRRDKLGSFLLDYVSFRYLPDGCIDLYLVRENAQVTSSIDQLMEEDEQRQLEDENRTTF